VSQLLPKLIVTSCDFYIKRSMCPPCCWTSHSSRSGWDQWNAASATVCPTQWHFTRSCV